MNNIFEDFIIDNEIYVDEHNWNNIVNNYNEEFIIKEISDAIVLFKIKLPYRNITLNDVETDYNNLKNLDSSILYSHDSWISKFNYKYSYLNEYINNSNVGNKASDYFHQIERWKCDATGYPSPQKTWENEKYRLTLFKSLFSLKVKEINPQILRNLISLRKYIAAQFRPSAAKLIYDLYGGENVLDFSMGWGDRILGAYASDNVKKYVGIDPNINLFDGYVKQVEYYNNISPDKKEFNFIYGCAEDEKIVLTDKFDLIFTSPPYFDKEKYDQSENQSYIKYKSFNSWLKDFLFKSIELRSKNLKRDGYLIINISDIYTRKKLYNICDNMNDYIISTGLFEYIGAIGLKMPKRPMSISSEISGVFAEPIWIYRKK